jgi:CheY-like chemotaxis protein
MEAVGQLAGGIAHDFNNLLTIMNGFTERVAMSLQPGTTAHRHLGEVLKAGERAAELTRQLLSFARNQIPKVGVVRLDGLVSDMNLLMTRVLGEGVRLLVEAAPGLWSIRADQSQVEQVLMNLAVNARDAMPAGGVLTIRLSNVIHGAGQLPEPIDAPPGRFVRLTITDTGEGMDEATRLRVFEPYFTTKDAGKGTGLGLFMVYGIVRAHGGSITVESEPGRGTTFRLDWPAEITATKPGSGRVRRAVELPHGTETVLIAEDEGGVRDLTAEVLKGCGYRVVTASSGVDALSAAKSMDVIHLLITDVVMGEMGGRELAERLRAERPRIKVLFMSGYANDDVVHHGVVHDRVHYLAKPFTPAALAVKAREVLDGKE